MTQTDLNPHEQLVHKVSSVTKPGGSVIGAHDHLAEPFGGGWDEKPFQEMLDQMDPAGVTHFADLLEGYRFPRRFLETDDEYFNYSIKSTSTQGKCYVQGLYLPEDFLENIYQLIAKGLIKID